MRTPRLAMAVGLIALGAAIAALATRTSDEDAVPAPARGRRLEVAAPTSHVGSAALSLGRRRRPNPPAAKERVEARHAAVEAQIASPQDGRDPVTDEAVLEALRSAPRHVFVPAYVRAFAYSDSPLPIGSGQTISQPYVVALMTEHLALGPDARVLEVGTGSGYQAAVLAHLTPNVYTIEIVEELAERALSTLRDQGYGEVRCRRADGYFGWPEEAPFDAIIVTCAAGHLPPPLWEQLKPGGRIVVPIGGPFDVQRLVVLTKTSEGKRSSRTVAAVQFVPMLGAVDRER